LNGIFLFHKTIGTKGLSMANLPKKLNKQPLIEAVFEMRFEAPPLASNVLSGIFFTKFGNVQIERLPVTEIPQQLRDKDPSFRYLPQFRILWKGYALLIGDRVFAIVSAIPYLGWEHFKEIILELVTLIKETNIKLEIERYSLKYVNLIEALSVREQLEHIKFNLKLGTYQVTKEAVNIRIEIPKDSLINVIQIVSNGMVELKPGEKKEGIIINIDSIANGPHSDFWATLSANLEKAHVVGKSLFFDFLQEETLKLLEPSYDE
jgi:uncharacterized protein (TIGR04255 family)